MIFEKSKCVWIYTHTRTSNKAYFLVVALGASVAGAGTGAGFTAAGAVVDFTAAGAVTGAGAGAAAKTEEDRITAAVAILKNDIFLLKN